MITLAGLLSVIESQRDITINLFDETGLLIIRFEMKGYEALDDFLCDDPVTKIVVKNTQLLEVTIDTTGN